MSFRLRTILGIALIELVLLSVLLFTGLRFMASSAETEFRQRTDATARAYSVAARDALISSDLAVLQALTREMLNYPGVAYARVRDAQGKTLVEFGSPQALARPPRVGVTDIESLPDGVFDVTAAIAEAGTTFGHIEVGVTATDLVARLAGARRFGIGMALAEVLLVALFSWLLGGYLTRQLRDLTQGSQKLADGDLGVQIPVRGRDELAQTAVAFNSMSQSMAQSHAELARQQQELLLRGRIIDTTTVGTVVADALRPDMPIIDVNPAFTAITGYSPEEVLGRNCRFLQGPETDPRAVARLREAIAAGRESSELLQNFRKDGTPFWNDLHVSPIRDAEGQVTHFVALQSDVTERVQAEKALAAREAYLNQVLNTTHDGIIVVDAQGIVESFNAGAAAMFGQTEAEVVGQRVSGIVPEPHRSKLDNFLEYHLRTGDTGELGVEREFEASRRDGSLLWIALRVARLDMEGRQRFIGVVHDITERKLGEIALHQAKDAAEEAASAKSDFLANMSHEIRTPMHGMLGSVEMLRDTPLTTQQRRHLDTAATSASLLLGVIDEILDFSRLEAGKLRIESIEFDLRRTVEDVTAMLGQRAHDKRIELACYVAPEVPPQVRGDPIRLRQVLVNLVGNAIKFTERGEVVVSVQMVDDPGMGSALRFEVRDTGIGIPDALRERLFEPFTQADTSTSRRFGGSGLGLSISRRLVALMDGVIDYDSREGAGTTFWFKLPALVPPASKHLRQSPDFAGTSVLVVDDNATNRIILHRYLTAWGGQSGSAAGGDEALAKLQDAAIAGRPYDLALLDLNMPGVDGYDLVARIQSDPALADMPLIMLSSSTQDPARMVGLRVDIWLDKPVRQSDLHDAIATVLTHQRQPSTASPSPAGTLMFAGERVLLVEDNPTTGDVGQQMLRKRGLDVQWVTDGVQAVTAVQRGGIDIVLMDVQMPRMDGYQATQALRAWESEGGHRRTPIIALTAHALAADRARCLAAGMDDFVTKPFSSSMLASVVARWLSPPGQTESSGGTPVLDPARLHEVQAAMGEQMPELLKSVHDALALQAQALESAGQQHDAQAGRDHLHRIKNLAGDVGSTRLHTMAGDLERALDAAPDTLPPMASVLQACRETLEALQRLFEQRTPS